MLRRFLPGFASIFVLLVLFVTTENQFAPSFTTCIRQERIQEASLTAKDEHEFFSVRVERQFVCSLRLIDAHSGFFAALAGFIVALFTFTLWRSTNKLWDVAEQQRKDGRRNLRAQIATTKASLVIAEKSANAAKASADALTSAERAYVFLVVEDANLADAVSAAFESSPNSELVRITPRDRAAPWVEFRFENHGKTPANIQQISVGMSRAEKMPEPDEIPVMKRPIQRWSDVIGAAGRTENDTIIDAALTIAEADMFRGGGINFFFYGHIIYEDVFGAEHKTAFCWAYGRGRNFGAWGGQKYNYRT